MDTTYLNSSKTASVGSRLDHMSFGLVGGSGQLQRYRVSSDLKRHNIPQYTAILLLDDASNPARAKGRAKAVNATRHPTDLCEKPIVKTAKRWKQLGETLGLLCNSVQIQKKSIDSKWKEISLRY